MRSSHSSPTPGRTSSAQKSTSSKTTSSGTATSKKKKSFRKKRIFLLSAAGIFVGLILCFFLFSRPDPALSGGLAYLEKQDQKDITRLDQNLSGKKQERILKAVETGQSSIFTLFNNALIFGDSRAYGFASYQYLPFEQVIAAAGNTILNISDSVDLVAKVKPEKIYFAYGINDMGLGIGKDQEENGYGKMYEEQIDQLLAVSPNSKIYLNSIIPAAPQVVKQTPRWGQVDEYNAQIEALCKKRGWTYVDNSKLADNGNAEIYADDGIHLETFFYPDWASNMIFAGS